jgi:carbon storage regulator CsrA
MVQMLSLTRNDGESIVIETPSGDWIEVSVSMDRGKVKLGIEAPIEYRIVRKELIDDIALQEQVARKTERREQREQKRMERMLFHATRRNRHAARSAD